MERQDKCKNCNIKCGLIRVSPDVLRFLEDGYQKLCDEDSNSLLKQFLTKQIFDQLKNKKTSFGSSLLDCVQSGYANHDSVIGIYAPDPEAYIVFSPIFDPIIENYHVGFSSQDKHPKLDWGELNNLENLDPNGEYVISTRVRCCRSLEGYPFNPCMNESQYREIEANMKQIFRNMTGELEGEYTSLVDMTRDEQNDLINSHFLYKEGDKFLYSAKSYRYWPIGRGIFINPNKTFMIWVNGEDHLRIISMQPGGNLANVYKRMIDGVRILDEQLTFCTSSKLGFLTFCPSNLGTTVRASVHIKLPKLSLMKEKLESVAQKYHLHVQKVNTAESEDEIYDISNRKRLGLNEGEAIREMHDGILEIIRIEESLD